MKTTSKEADKPFAEGGIDSLLRIISSNSVYVGGEDILGVGPIVSPRPEDDTGDYIDRYLGKYQECLKEMKIRIGTLLKVDNVSFLLGAGCSLESGGVSLSNIPYLVERSLIDEGYKSGKRRRWLKLFYSLISAFANEQYNTVINQRKRALEIIKGMSFDIESRSSELSDISISNANPKDLDEDELYKFLIPINFEAMLTKIHELIAVATNSVFRIQHVGRGTNSILLKDLEELYSRLKGSLILNCQLPVEGKEESLETHKRLLKKVLTRPLNLKRVNIFTLNYDTLVEQAADAEGIVMIDGFVGNIKRVFRPESFEQDLYFPAQTTEGRVHRLDRVLHLYKLHGSISWFQEEPSIANPHGLISNSNYPQESDSVITDAIVYPTPLKYQQTLGLPYSELFRRFSHSIVQPQSVLFVIGYGFGDEHVNAIIRQALSIPSFTLVIVDPHPNSNFVNVLEEQRDQRIWLVRGFDIDEERNLYGLGTYRGFVEHLLPDLRDEDISKKVLNTFRSLSRSMSDYPGDLGVDENAK